MADFCRQCCTELWGAEEPNDFADMCQPGQMIHVLCEGCGPIAVDHDGTCLSPDCLKKHGA